MERPEELDQALLTAVEHTEEKQRELVQEPQGSPRAEVLATDVVQRVEDVDVLATEARAATEAEASAAGVPADQRGTPTD